MLFGRMVRTVDSHTEGNPTRVVVGGVPVPPGGTLLEQSEWLQQNDDALRRMLNFEPRGSGLMCTVLLLPAIDKSADFAVIISEQDTYVPMSGHNIIGTATTVVATGMVKPVAPVTQVRFETLAGLVDCDVTVDGGRISSVSFNNVDSFLLHDRVTINVESIGDLIVDVAYGGDMYVFVDADEIGVRLAVDNDAELNRVSGKIRRAVADQLDIVHPERPYINSCYQVLFTSATKTVGDYKQTILCPPGSLDRSPCGTGTSARTALLYARGEIGLGEPRKFEGPLGTYMIGEVVAQDTRNGVSFITPRITASSYITGFHDFVLDPNDPLADGFRVGPAPENFGY
ncbi:MAG: proline racemase family protein [Rhodospirillales bacterium]|nr:proline racemase family protein [Rhodospirillales bacterium]